MSSPIYSSIQDSGIASTHEIDMDSEFNPNESALDIDEAAENDDNSDKFSSEHLDNNGNESPQDADNANSASTPGSHKSKSSSKHRSSSIGSSGNPKNADDKRRSHSRSFQTLHGGSKIKHLKKLDGEPLWRADIQYDFLAYIFHNTEKVFHNSYESSDRRYTFADIYIDAMARSSKTSKILCEKLLGDRKAGLNMAMVCLLVNIGRMNTTLNFFPEMRAQLRTYHPIPSLQTYTDQSDYKQLQDAPRLKSILKGACEDRSEPSNFTALDDIKTYPKTNPINLIFLMSTYASKLQNKFFVPPYEFHDLIMNTSLSSESRGRSFLWLIWAFLETDLRQDQLRNNPFGAGQDNYMKVPEFDILTPEQLMLENVDPENEIEFGNTMTRERKTYIDSNQQFPFVSAPAGNTPVAPSPAPKPKEHSGGRKKGATLKNVVSNGGGSETGTPAPNGSNVSIIPIVNNDDEVKSDVDEPKSPTSSKNRSYRVTTHSTPKVIDPVVYKTTAREKQCQIEIQKMLQIKDRENKRRRHHAGGMYREWVKIRNHDPLYDSDFEDYPEEITENEKPAAKGVETKEDLATLLVHKKRKRHVQPQEVFSQSSSTVNESAECNITFSGPNNEIHSAATAQLVNSHPNTGNTTNGKGPSKITVKTRIDYPSSFGEESLAMARAFRRSLRWLKRWDRARLKTETEIMERIQNERLNRDKLLKEREMREYGQVERAVQEERERLAQEIEKEFEMAVKEKSERRRGQSAGNEEDEAEEEIAGKVEEEVIIPEPKPAKKSKKKSVVSSDSSAVAEDEKPKKPKAPRKRATKKNPPVLEQELEPITDSYSGQPELHAEDSTYPPTAPQQGFPVEFGQSHVAPPSSGSLPMFDTSMISPLQPPGHAGYEHAPLGMAPISGSPTQHVSGATPIMGGPNIYGAPTGLVSMHRIEPIGHDMTTMQPMHIGHPVGKFNSPSHSMSGFPLMPNNVMAQHIGHHPELGISTNEPLDDSVSRQQDPQERSNIMSLGNLLDNDEDSILG